MAEFLSVLLYQVDSIEKTLKNLRLMSAQSKCLGANQTCLVFQVFKHEKIQAS